MQNYLEIKIIICDYTKLSHYSLHLALHHASDLSIDILLEEKNVISSEDNAFFCTKEKAF